MSASESLPGPRPVYLLLFNLLRFERWTQRIIAAPVMWLLRKDRVQEAYRKRGVKNVVADVEKAVYGPVISPSSIIANAHSILLVMWILFGTACLLSGLAGKRWLLDFPVWISVFVPAGAAWLTAELVVFRGDRHLQWYEEFERMSPAALKRSGWLSLFVVLAIWGYGIGMAVVWL